MAPSHNGSELRIGTWVKISAPQENVTHYWTDLLGRVQDYDKREGYVVRVLASGPWWVPSKTHPELLLTIWAQPEDLVIYDPTEEEKAEWLTIHLES